ncbi:MAG: nicotianamine synthase family protein [Pseudomonadota bacterium]
MTGQSEITSLCREILGAGRASTFQSNPSVLQDLYDALEPHLRSDVALNGNLPSHEDLSLLYAIRARFERELEFGLARDELDRPSARERIGASVQRKNDALPETFYDAIERDKPVLFVGSGPYPTTAMALSSRLSIDVTCLDFDSEANELGARYIRVGGYADRIQITEGEISRFGDICQFGTIVCAFLVGVGLEPGPLDRKTRLINTVLDRMPLGQKLILRSPLGLGALLYPKVEITGRTDVAVRVWPDPSTSVPYDKPFVALTKTSIDTENRKPIHAH